MKIYKIALGLGLTLMFTACDNIADNPDDRFIPVDRLESSRNVLVQEFSGQRCVNCPDGAAAIAQMVQSYGENIVAMSLHPENTIFTTPLGNANLVSPIATEYYKFYNSPSSFPYAVFDGHITANSNGYQKWEADAKAAMEQGSPAVIDLIAKYDSNTKQVTVNYNVNFTYDFKDRLDIVIWVIESGIVAPQQLPANKIDGKYVHNHILRASLNGTWGEPLADGSDYKMNKDYRGTLTAAFDDAWVPANCEIAVALLHPDTKYVEQAAQCHIY